MKPIALLLALVLLTSCAHQAKHYNAPDRTAVVQATNELRQHIHEAKATAEKARKLIESVSAVARTQRDLIASDKTKLEVLFQNAPPELRGQIAEVQSNNQQLAISQTQIEAELSEAGKQHTILATQHNEVIPKAEAKLDSANVKYSEDVDALVLRANTAEEGWAKDSAEIVRLRTQSWITKILIGLGSLALIILLALFILSKTVWGGAKIASYLH